MARAADTIEDWLGEPLWDFAAKSAGVGLSGTIIEVIKAQGWAEGIGDEIVQAVLGLAARKWGDKYHEQLPNFGSGVLYDLVGRVVFEERIAPLLTEKFGKGAGNPAFKKAFHQRYGRDPTFKEMASIRKYQQQQQQQQPDNVPKIPMTGIDYHYIGV